MNKKNVGNKLPIYRLKTPKEILEYYREWTGNNKYNQHQGSQDRFPALQPNELRPVFAGPAHNSLEMIGDCLVIQQRQAKNYCQQIEKTIVPGDNNHEL